MVFWVCAWQSQVWFAWLCRLDGMSQRGGGQFRSPFWWFICCCSLPLCEFDTRSRKPAENLAASSARFSSYPLRGNHRTFGFALPALKLEWVRELAIHRAIPGVSSTPAPAITGPAPAVGRDAIERLATRPAVVRALRQTRPPPRQRHARRVPAFA